MLERRITMRCEASARPATTGEAADGQTAAARAARRSRSLQPRGDERVEPIRRREVIVQGMRISLPALRFLDGS